MKPTPRTDALMRRLHRYLKAQRGRQTQLAHYLYPRDPDMGSTRISEWMHRVSNPNGETTLTIQEWLEGRD